MVGGHMKTWDPTCNHALLDNSQAVRIWHLTFQFRYKTLLENKIIIHQNKSVGPKQTELQVENIVLPVPKSGLVDNASKVTNMQHVLKKR